MRATSRVLGLPAAHLLADTSTRGLTAKRDDEEEGENSSYMKMKNVASRSGDPAKEWMQGSKEHASAYSQSAEQVYEATKRAIPDITAHTKEAKAHGGLKDVKQMAGDGTKGAGLGAATQMASAAGAKASEAAHKVVDAVKEGLGVGEGVSDAHDLPSARAQFEAGRTEAQKAEGNKDRKSQLTDEAVGDNPAEQRTWDEHDNLPTEVLGLAGCPG
ncbi:hypothetical protein D9Q98_008198 [Chlorella vulgaris]|uniref:Uncharacterized protein n=1 Tax=Chlorella vulgaris TaxID=3077 RepID=A0A9D4TG66_CHLVU|nr:hypothetical protein D9Q98_008198 [Chlorella vulgaris]